MSPKIPPHSIPVVFQTIHATTRKLKATWTVEAAKDFHAYYGFKSRNQPPSSIEESNELFRLAFKFNEIFPPGTIVQVDESQIMGLNDFERLTSTARYHQVKVVSEAVVLISKSSVGFLCSESKDDSDYYFVDDLKEFADGKLKP